MFKEMFGAFKKPETPDSEALIGAERELIKQLGKMSAEEQGAIKGLIKQSTDFFNQQK